MLAILGGTIGFIFGAALARVLGKQRFWHSSDSPIRPGAHRSGPRLHRGAGRQPDTIAARSASASCAHIAGPVVFWRLVFQLLRGSRARLTVAILALVSGAAVISGLLNLDFGVEYQLTQQFRTLGANIVIAPKTTESAPESTLTEFGADE